MPSALFLSPHLDDVAFSCGGIARRLADAGWQTVLCTIFTRSMPNPQGFALACQLDKGLTPEIDYMALRRAEDDAAAKALRAVEVEWLGLPEAPHRGYHSAPALFGEQVAADDATDAVEAALAPRLAAGHDLVFAPQGLGDHIDHRHVRDAVARLAAAHGRSERVAWYRDTPYAIRHPGAAPRFGTLPPDAEIAVPIDGAPLAAKLDSCAAYASQIGFQFGGEAAMREALSRFAAAEAERLNAKGAAEVIRGAPYVARLLG